MSTAGRSTAGRRLVEQYRAVLADLPESLRFATARVFALAHAVGNKPEQVLELARRLNAEFDVPPAKTVLESDEG